MTGATLEAPAARQVSPDALAVGDVVTIHDVLPSDLGYVHVVDDVRDLGRGYVRVWFEVYENGVRRGSALEGRECFRWDRVYDLTVRRPAGHRSGCSCRPCRSLSAAVRVEVVS